MLQNYVVAIYAKTMEKLKSVFCYIVEQNTFQVNAVSDKGDFLYCLLGDGTEIKAYKPNRSTLGDRFSRVYIDEEIDEAMMWDILRGLENCENAPDQPKAIIF